MSREHTAQRKAPQPVPTANPTQRGRHTTAPQDAGVPEIQLPAGSPPSEPAHSRGRVPLLQPEPSGPAQPQQAGHNWRDRLVVDTLRLMIRHKVVVVLLVLLTTVSGGVSTLLVPPYYTAKAVIFPPPSDNPLGGFGMAGVAGLMGSLGLGSTGPTQFHLYQEFIVSRTLIEQVLQTSLVQAGYNGTLMQYLQIEEPDAVRRNEIAVESIRVRTLFEADKQTGIVTVGFTDNNPKVAALVVNQMIEHLDRFDANVAAQRATERRKFIENRMAEAVLELNAAEEALETFRQQNMRIGNAPSLILEQARLQRELEFEQQIYLTLRKEYELARIEEERSVPVVNVLDEAKPPAVPAGPSILRSVATGGMMGVLLVTAMFLLMTLQPIRLLRAWGILGSPSRS